MPYDETGVVFGHPQDDEYHEYYGLYIRRIGDDDLLPRLSQEHEVTLALFDSLDDERTERRYQPDKWSVKEVLGHVMDVERVFAVRALAFARADRESLPSFDQHVYAAGARHHQRTWEALVAEHRAVRASTMALLASLDETAVLRRGVASGNEFSVRALAYCIGGHEIHHRDVIRERYL